MTPLALVMLCLLGTAAPLLLAAWLLGAWPRRRAALLAVVPALASCLTLWTPEAIWGAVALDVVVLTAIIVDLATLPRRSALGVERHCGRIASLRKPHRVTLTALNHGRRTLMVWMRDGVPHELTAKPAEFALRLSPRSRATVQYDLRANRRGAFTLDPVFLRVAGRLGLFVRMLQYPLESAIHVYPDMKQLGEYALLARTNRLSLMGVRRVRKVGQDHDFERLRDYLQDDNYKHIDWRSTARRRKLTVRDYQSSQSQRIIFLIDCGRMMSNEASGLSLLDHALNAMLMLAYVALRQGDSVGMICFSDEIHAYIPPKPGMQQMNKLLHGSFDRFPSLVESRYDLAFRYLATHCRKRSLVVLATNVIDEVNSSQIQRYLTNLVGRHLPMAVLLRDRRMFDAVEPEHPTETQLWPAAAAADILAWRCQALADLMSQGVLALDCFPEQMTAPIINRYLEIKARHLL